MIRIASGFLACLAALVATAGQVQAGLILFGIQDDGRIAQNLPYGPTAITEADSAFLSTLVGSQSHDRWFQRAVDGAGNTLYEIDWQFSTTKTVAERFQDAVSVGESVTWTVTSPFIMGSQILLGTWRFSDGAGNMTSKFSGSGSVFSDDDGIWGAGTGLIDGDFNSNINNWTWGYGNYNGQDTYVGFIISDGTLRLNGATQSNLPIGFKNFMYVDDGQVSEVPEPSSLVLFGIGACVAAGGAALRRRREKRQKALV
jgi:hypothetical protein